MSDSEDLNPGHQFLVYALNPSATHPILVNSFMIFFLGIVMSLGCRIAKVLSLKIFKLLY